MRNPIHAAQPAYLVPVDVIAGQIGATAEHAASQVRRYGYEVATDSDGRPGVAAETAAMVVETWRAEIDDHQAKWSAYQDYLAQRRQAVADERQAAFEKAQEEAREHQRRYGAAMSEKMAQQRQADAERAAAEQAAKVGSPVDFDTFARKGTR